MKTVPELWFDPQPWINGRSYPSRSQIVVTNPATGAVLKQVGESGPEEATLAIEGAAIAWKDWKRSSPFDRGQILKRTASLLLEKRDQLARLLTAEQGKIYSQSLGEIDYAASFFQWFGEEARRSSGRIASHPDGKREFHIHHQPVGVAGLITPWNFPLAQGAKKIAACLAAGCTAVWKPSERTPLIALALGHLLQEAGLPSGVLQILPGPGAPIGEVLVNHPQVRVLSLTGSTATGRSLMAKASQSIKRISLELGGNAPFIILPEADLEFAAAELMRLKLFVSGQVCVTANRIFVYEPFEKQLLDILGNMLASIRVGNGLEEGIDAGPLIHSQACQQLDRLVSSALSQGAQLVARNESHRCNGALSQGSFFAPTILRNISDSMTIAQQEIFGPVLPVLTYRTFDELIERANATPYGLAAYVFGEDVQRCQAIARELEVGIVGINEWRPLKAEIPFGGVKESGFGAEGGEEGLREFLATQVLSIPKPRF